MRTMIVHITTFSSDFTFNGIIIIIIIIIVIIMKEFIVRLLQCGHEHRCITLSIKLKSVVNNQ